MAVKPTCHKGKSICFKSMSLTSSESASTGTMDSGASKTVSILCMSEKYFRTYSELCVVVCGS